MAYVDTTRRGSWYAYESTLCLNESEVRMMLPQMKKACRRAEEMYWKYMDIQQSGEATTAQQNLLTKYEDEYNALKHLIEEAEAFIS